jgi:hypothetical protein
MGSVARARLAASVENAMRQVARLPAVDGRDECTLRWANVIREALGYDPARPYRGRYWSRGGMGRALGPGGLVGAIETAAARYSWREIAPSDAQVGDIGIVPVLVGGRATRRTLRITAICRAPDWFLLRQDVGFAACRAKVVERAWAVV